MTINLNRVADVRTEGKMVADKYIGGNASQIFAAMLDDMVGLTNISQALSKTPVVGGHAVSDHSGATTRGAKNQVEGTFLA